MLCAFCAQAELIYIAIEAEVDYVLDPCDHLEGKITTSSTITGYYCYESTTLDSDLSSSGGEYLMNVSPYGLFLTGGGLNFNTDPCNVEFAIGMLNNALNRDTYVVRSHNNLSLANGTTINDFFWFLEDSTMTALSGDALPTTAPVLGDWGDNRLYISGGPRETEFGIDATVTSATVVPEPVTILLLSLGALSLRKRSQ